MLMAIRYLIRDWSYEYFAPRSRFLVYVPSVSQVSGLLRSNRLTGQSSTLGHLTRPLL